MYRGYLHNTSGNRKNSQWAMKKIPMCLGDINMGEIRLVQKKQVKIRSLRLSHCDIFSAVSFTNCSSCWLIRKMNFWWLLRVLKFGHFSMILSNHLALLPYSLQSMSMCCSSSTNVLQNLQNLFSLGIFGLQCLPSSIMSLWSESLNFVITRLSFLLSWSKYGSYSFCDLNPLSFCFDAGSKFFFP